MLVGNPVHPMTIFPPALLPRSLPVLILAGALALNAAEPRRLFDGQSLQGWTIQNGGQFSARDGVIALNRGAGWLRSNETFGDFVLLLEFRFLEPKANSGIFVRTGPTSKADEKGYPDNGYQIQCMDTLEGDRPLGCLIPYGAPPCVTRTDVEALKKAYRPTKEWNTFEITCRGETIAVKLNGVEITRVTEVKNRSGHVGIQGELGLLEFRRIELTELAPATSAASNALQADRRELVFSGVQAEQSEPARFTIFNHSDAPLKGIAPRIVGPHAGAFKLVDATAFDLKARETRVVAVTVNPAQGQLGALSATCEFVDTTGGESGGVVGLFGLSAVGIEGPREPGLAAILATTGLKADIGWDGIHTHTKAELSGVEIAEQRFRRAAPGAVTMEPVARYSPDFLLPFGYYREVSGATEVTAIGTLALKTPSRHEHNCLYPSLASGVIQFDPGAESFGVFTASPLHVAYSEDAVNRRLAPKHLAHAARVFPVKDRDGKTRPNAYLICFEEAFNGDYQDYVFLLSNVVPTR